MDDPTTSGTDPTTTRDEMKKTDHETYLKALDFACALHAELRKGGRGVPYLTHLLDVSSTVFEDGGSLEAAIAGLLHDTVEDKNITYDHITKMYGTRVALIVEGCTDSGELSPTDVKGAFLERKKAHLAGLVVRARRVRSGSAAEKKEHPEDVEVLTVTAADKLSNLRATLGDLDDVGLGYFDHFKGGLFVTHWYYATVVGILAEGLAGPGGVPTSRAVRDLQRELVRLDAWRDRARAELAPWAEPLARRFAELDAPGAPRFGRGRTEQMPPDEERTLVAFEALRVARAAGADPRAAVEAFLVDCFVPGASKRWAQSGDPFPADLVPFADAVLAAGSRADAGGRR